MNNLAIDKLTTNNSVSGTSNENAYISIMLTGTEAGFYKQLEHKVIAYRHFQNGREVKVCTSNIEAENWILKNFS